MSPSPAPCTHPQADAHSESCCCFRLGRGPIPSLSGLCPGLQQAVSWGRGETPASSVFCLSFAISAAHVLPLSRPPGVSPLPHTLRGLGQDAASKAELGRPVLEPQHGVMAPRKPVTDSVFSVNTQTEKPCELPVCCCSPLEINCLWKQASLYDPGVGGGWRGPGACPALRGEDPDSLSTGALSPCPALLHGAPSSGPRPAGPGVLAGAAPQASLQMSL